MDYIPHTSDEIRAMLDEIGVESVDALFEGIPGELRIEGLELPAPWSEMEAWRTMSGLSRRLEDGYPTLSFVGGGAYEHFIPSVVEEVVGRSEFYTCYTPYQAEVSQGTLRTIFEFQSMVCELTDMEVANASMYDGASALAEAVLMGLRIREGSKILVPRSLHPLYRRVMETYLSGLTVRVEEIPWTGRGTMDPEVIAARVDGDTSSVVVQSPNFLGGLEPTVEIADALGNEDALLIAVVNPLSLGLLEPPGTYGADIAVGEVQPLGIPLSFGGPYAGFFATKMTYVRKMPGRLVGETVDVEGRRGYVLTLQTREQHIRREKATSNICSNQALCALRATVYLASLGPRGLEEVAQMNWDRSHDLGEQLAVLPDVERVFDGPFFNEFVVRVPGSAAECLQALRREGICGGLDLGRFYPEMGDHLLVCATEMKTDADLDRCVEAWKCAGYSTDRR